ncbi:MAG: aminotransferase class I/II-fold pyridoxal phosphate-dependent enzyme [Acutalibacteraceae bacterium]|jgi:cystathionine beta-lyase family protein involved in aluminum resistance
MNITNFFNIDKKLIEFDKKVLKSLTERFAEIDDVTEYNQLKVLSAFIKNGVSEVSFAGSTGYGYGDRGREILEKVMADCMGAEDALMRHNFVSGTHTLTVALFGILRPGDKVICLTGRPYDTITGVFGIDKKCDGSLKDFGIEYGQIDLLPDGTPDLETIKNVFRAEKPKMAYIQRSRGYSTRPSLTVEDIEKLVKIVKEVSPDSVVMVDNCYGEFVEKKEPCDVGADIVAGSLIKNPGGGIAPTGGYIAGRKDLIEKCAMRLTCPGVGREVGATLGHSRELYMGLFAAPHVVGEAMKTAVYAAAFFELLGFPVSPASSEKRGDIIQCVTLGSAEGLVAFCQGMQAGAPVDSYVVPEPWDMPGYTDPVIMAAGAFTMGASIELSADGPLREPYAAWLQGGLNFHSAKAGILLAAQKMYEKGAINI